MATIALAALGSQFGPWATYGLTVVGAYIDNKLLQKLAPPIEGPRLDNLRVTLASEGSPMNIIYGTGRCGGVVLWTLDEVIEVENEEEIGGCGGGPTTLTYSYYTHVDIGICDNLIEAVEKIWSNGKLIYDADPDITITSDAIAATVEIVKVGVLGLEGFDGEIVDASLAPGDTTVDVEIADTETLSPNHIFTVAGDSQQYIAISYTLLSSGAGLNVYRITFAPGSQASWSNGAVVTFSDYKAQEVHSIFSTSVADDDLSQFKAGQPLTSSGWTGAGAPELNGTFTVLYTTKDGNDSSVAVSNIAAIADPGGESVTLFQELPTQPADVASDIRVYFGTESQDPDPLVEAYEGEDNTPAYRGHAHVVFEFLNVTETGGRLQNMEFQVRAKTNHPVGEVIGDLCERAGLTSDQYDVSALDDPPMIFKGLVLNGLQTPGTVISLIMMLHGIIVQDRGGVLTFLLREDAPQTILDEDDLGVASSGGMHVDPIILEDIDDEDLPNEVQVRYSDPEKEYQTGMQPYSGSTHVPDSPDVIGLDAFTLSAQDAQCLARELYWTAHANRHRIEIPLPPSLLASREYDVHQFEAFDETYRVLLARVDRGDDLSVIVQGMNEVSSTLEHDECPIEEDPHDDQELQYPPALAFLAMDYAPLASAHEQEYGYYFGVLKYMSTPAWKGANLYFSTDGGASYTLGPYVPYAAAAGVAVGALASADPHRWDRGNSVTITLLHGAPASCSEAECLAGKNHFYIGNEHIGAATVTPAGPNAYTLSTLLRGLRNTEDAITKHVASEPVVWLNSAGVQFLPLNLAQVGVTTLVKPVPKGGLEADAEAYSVTPESNTRRCWPPCHIEGTRDASNNLTVTFVERSRAVGTIFGPAAAPLLEPSLEHEFDVLDGTTVVRTIAVSGTPTTFTYTAAEQTTDGLTPGDPVDLEGYMLSAVFGRGKKQAATV